MRRRFVIVCLVLSVLAGLYACKSRPRDPDAEVEAFITKVEKLTEARDLGQLKEVIDEQYQDSHGLNKRRVVSLLQLQFLKRKKIHVISRIVDLEVTDKATSARVDLLAGLAGRPIEGLLGLKDVRAEIMRFKIRLIYDGDDWLVQRVDWSRARLSDFRPAAPSWIHGYPVDMHKQFGLSNLPKDGSKAKNGVKRVEQYGVEPEEDEE